MKKIVAAFALVAAPALAMADQGVRFDTILSESGGQVGRPSVWVGFGQPAVIEVPGKVRVVASAEAPSGERSLVKAEIFQFIDDKWVSVHAPSMVADLSQAPSFELTIKDSPYRVVVMPRMAAQPSSNGS